MVMGILMGGRWSSGMSLSGKLGLCEGVTGHIH